MKYALLIYTKPGSMAELDESQRQALRREYYAIRDEPGFIDGAQLAPVQAATTVRVSGGDTLTTDGPFADTKEVFGGYYVFELDNLDSAIALAARVPAARMGGSLEVRPLMEA